MKKYPAIALIEFSSIAIGIMAGDSMVKKSPITMLKTGTVHDGKYLILIGGSVASVEEAYNEGVQIGSDSVIDKMLLPNVHDQVHDAILGKRIACSDESVGIIETNSVAATIKSADAGVKGADVNIVEIRLADDIGGKAFAIFNGAVEEIETAVRISKESVTKTEFWYRDTIIPNIHSEMSRQIDSSTEFFKAKTLKLKDGEI